MSADKDGVFRERGAWHAYVARLVGAGSNRESMQELQRKAAASQSGGDDELDAASLIEGARFFPEKLHVWRAMGENGLVGYDVRFVADPAGNCLCLGCMGQIDGARVLALAPRLATALATAKGEVERLREDNERQERAEGERDAAVAVCEAARQLIEAVAWPHASVLSFKGGVDAQPLYHALVDALGATLEAPHAP